MKKIIIFLAFICHQGVSQISSLPHSSSFELGDNELGTEVQLQVPLVIS